jgi:hypothetical protein
MRLLPAVASLAAWGWLSQGTLIDPANVLLVAAVVTGGLGVVSIRRYWLVRTTSRSRRDSSLLR